MFSALLGLERQYRLFEACPFRFFVGSLDFLFNFNKVSASIIYLEH